MNVPAMKMPSMKISAPLSGLSSKTPSVSASSFKMPKSPSFKTTQIKMPKSSVNPANFNISKFSKPVKMPATPKMKILKTAVKKVKNVGF